MEAAKNPAPSFVRGVSAEDTVARRRSAELVRSAEPRRAANQSAEAPAGLTCGYARCLLHFWVSSDSCPAIRLELRLPRRPCGGPGPPSLAAELPTATSSDCWALKLRIRALSWHLQFCGNNNPGLKGIWTGNTSLPSCDNQSLFASLQVLLWRVLPD